MTGFAHPYVQTVLRIGQRYLPAVVSRASTGQKMSLAVDRDIGTRSFGEVTPIVAAPSVVEQGAPSFHPATGSVSFRQAFSPPAM